MTAKSGPNFFLAAAGPALIFARICDRDSQVIATLVPALPRTGRTPGKVVSPTLPFLAADVLQDGKLWMARIAISHARYGARPVVPEGRFQIR